jgi:PqqD family protein of HPr-rel-A system
MTEPLFAGPAQNGLVSSALGDMTALYHRKSAITHLVVEPVPQILELLSAGPLSAPAILDGLGLVQDSDSLAALFARLDEMEKSGLIELR